MMCTRFRCRISTALFAALILMATSLGAQDVTVEVGVSGDEAPGGIVTLSANVTINDGSTIQGYSWTQLGGVPGALMNASTADAMITLGALGDYKAQLIHVLMEPPIAPEDLPPNVPPPEGEFPGGLQDRFQVVGLNHFALEEAGLVVVQVEVTTTSGTYTAVAEVHAELPWRVTTGLLNVPIGLPVLLHGKEQAAFDWELTPPGGSAAVLADATSQNPEFTPDVTGPYVVEVTDTTEVEAEASSRPTAGQPIDVLMTIYAGTWRGVITGQDADGRPVGDPACTGCHSGFAPDKFTPWMETGHAEIFTQNINNSGFWGPQCFECHTVGYDPDVDNGGIDEASDYQDFLDAGLIGNPDEGNWTTVLSDFPDTAQLANAQCENCHGPQSGSDAHGPSGPVGDPRISLASDVCASCHGEPLRHARFQQWQLSGHANYELAIDEGDSGSCSRCHTANGFLTWLPVLLGDEPGDPTDDITVDWTTDETHPQTCVTCHDPHDAGTTSGDGSNARVRITDNTPPLIAGFTATDVGRGALCMTCHNSRRGARNDGNFNDHFGTSEASRAPHGSAQADMLMGQNAYLVTLPQRANHADPEEVPDSCVTCHMEATPPPEALSYNQGGTNHTFFAREDICGDCHTFEDATAIQGTVDAMLMDLSDLIVAGIRELIGDQIAAGNTVDLGGDVTVTDVGDISQIQLAESRGRQAIIVTLNGEEIGPVRMNDVDVVPPMGDPFEIYDVANPNLVKAGWNYWLVSNDGSHGVHNPAFAMNVLDASREALESGGVPCVNDADTMCLNNSRFQVEVTWGDFQNNTGSGMVVPGQSNDSGLFWFFSADNWEMLVKVLDGCALNDRYWVFFAATTNVEFNLTVTDTETETVKMYTNPLGQDANAITDTGAFATCP